MKLQEALSPQKAVNPIREEIDELDRRKAEESGPVVTYQAIEWFERRASRRDAPQLTIRARAVFLNREACRLLGSPKRVRVGWDCLAGALVFVPTDKGGFSLGAGQFGGKTLCEQMRRVGFAGGRYDLELDGKRLIVRRKEA